MHSHTRAMIAASAYAFIHRKKVAGIYDHAAGQHLLIAAETRDDRLQGVDGNRSSKFGGTLPEIYDAGDRAFVSFEIDGTTVRGYDRASGGAYVAEVSDRLVQIYDHAGSGWFAFTVQVA